jgi:hypothetical protein
MTALLLISATGRALAQQPSPDQVNAVRQSCRADFMANCSGVQPGGRDAMECLKRNADKLSQACRAAVSAIGPALAPATAPAVAQPAPATPPKPVTRPAAKANMPASPPATQAVAPPMPPAVAAPAVAPLYPRPFMLPRKRLAIVAICGVDARTLCAGVDPGGGRIISCLAENASRLTPECYDALARESR